MSKIIRNQDDEEETVEIPKMSLLASSPMNALPPKKSDNEEEEEMNRLQVLKQMFWFIFWTRLSSITILIVLQSLQPVKFVTVLVET